MNHFIENVTGGNFSEGVRSSNILEKRINILELILTSNKYTKDYFMLVCVSNGYQKALMYLSVFSTLKSPLIGHVTVRLVFTLRLYV